MIQFIKNTIFFYEHEETKTFETVCKMAAEKNFSMFKYAKFVYSTNMAMDNLKDADLYAVLFTYGDMFLEEAATAAQVGSIIQPEAKAPVVKFNKSFEALYAIAMNMADQCIGQKSLSARMDKLREEYSELKDEVIPYIECIESEGKTKPSGRSLDDDIFNIIGELSDVLFVLLHIGHKFNTDAHSLLHMATTKMLSRMADPNYIAKV